MKSVRVGRGHTFISPQMDRYPKIEHIGACQHKITDASLLKDIVIRRCVDAKKGNILDQNERLMNVID